MTKESERKAVLAERERIAAWHERQALALEEAAARILADGGTIEVSHRSLVELHRASARSIRDGAE